MGGQNRAVAAVTVFLIGIGVLIQVIGLLTDLYSYKAGFLGLLAAVVVAISFLVYHRRGARDATVVFLLGLGLVLQVFGPLTDLYSYKVGFVGLVASWVVAITLRVYYGRSSRYD
ncbi:MAG: hypothetical protein FJ020_00560 [Chloroflexi bacterium]|nr:hypothetical protein [Chloroflexota bacterium]